jgi:hypothetical protein
MLMFLGTLKENRQIVKNSIRLFLHLTKKCQDERKKQKSESRVTVGKGSKNFVANRKNDHKNKGIIGVPQFYSFFKTFLKRPY